MKARHRYPTPEGEQRRSPPPRSTYGFQKLATEYFAQAPMSSTGSLSPSSGPLTALVSARSERSTDKEIMSGNVRLAMSHVVPDLIQKLIKGQDPLHILGDGQQVRHYTYGGDLARGIRLAIESPAAINEDFNLSTTESTTVIELAAVIWRKIKGSEPLRFISDDPYTYDVQKRIPSVEKARYILGFEATTLLSEALDKVIPWIRSQVERGAI